MVLSRPSGVMEPSVVSVGDEEEEEEVTEEADGDNSSLRWCRCP